MLSSSLKLIYPTILLTFLAAPLYAFAASFNISPSTGSFPVGSTFDVQIMLDTENQSINALEMSLKFPPDKLQLVSPSTGQSIISVWTSQPRFNNAEGRLDLQGGVVGGIKTNRGLIATVTFRVKSTGPSILKFLDNSKILLNDGLGTDVLRQNQGAVFTLTLPPPAGPIVASETHPDQSAWYKNQNAVFQWATDFGANGYSYVLNDDPVDVPDDISEGTKTSVAYKNVSNGTHYFHIKAFRDGVWGGVTHYAINVDAEAPAEFPVEILPSVRTTRSQPIINFATTDRLSGVDFYEVKIIPLSGEALLNWAGEPLFIESSSPYVPTSLSKGSYDVIVRAHDNAGNTIDITQRLKITGALFSFVDDEGVRLRADTTVTWPFVWIGLLLLASLLAYAAWRLRKWNHRLNLKRMERRLPNEVLKQLEELKTYRSKYGKALVFLIIVGGSFLFGNGQIYAQTQVLEPPVIETVSRTITNEEIFYLGGSTKLNDTEVIVYLQDLQNGNAYSNKVVSNERGEWFYRHDGFLAPGKYLVWVQSKLADEQSPPSPQVSLTVESTALQFGSSRLSLNVLYLIGLIVLLGIVIVLVSYVIILANQGRKKRSLLQKEIKEAEESIKRGFAILRRDVQAEMETIRRVKLGGTLPDELRLREEQLLKDLASVERYIGKEVWDVERVESAG